MTAATHDGHPPDSTQTITHSDPTIYFYRATGTYGFLSNLFPRMVIFEGRSFSCAEAAYQYGRAKKLGVAEWLITAPEPFLIACAAHALPGWAMTKNWNAIKVERMRAVLRAKFNPDGDMDLVRDLLETGYSHLIENSMTDSFWGIGKTGKGKNMLGRLLMEVREELR